MKLLKLLLILVALIFVAWGAFALLGFVAGLLYAIVKWALIIGVVALVGAGAYKLIAGPERKEYPVLSDAEAEMLKAERMLAELRRKELTK
jgi:hypothetical protein